MDTLFGIGIIIIAGYFVIKWVLKEDKKLDEPEKKVEPAKKIESDFVTGLNVAKEEVKAVEVVMKIIDVPKESAELLNKVQDAITSEAKDAAAELVKEVDQVLEEVKVQELRVKSKVKAKAKAIEAVVEAKVEKLEAAVKKTKAKK